MKRYIVLLVFIMTAVLASADNILWKEPVFAKSSMSALELVYSFVPDTKFVFDQTSNSISLVSVMGQEQKVKVEMNIHGSFAIKSVDSTGTALIEINFEKIFGTIGTDQMSVNFSTDERHMLADAGLEGLKAFASTPFRVKLNKKGKIVEKDTNMIDLLLAGYSGNSTVIHQLIDDVVGQIFIMLPEKQVKKGEVYNAGTVVKEVEELGNMEITTKYTVVDVSSDKKQVLLRPSSTFVMKNVKITKSDMKGWMLLDTDTGIIMKSSSSLDFIMTIAMPQFNTTMDMEQIVENHYSVAQVFTGN
ncbi:MAG: hypothetical protein JW874_12450 [Spirochaetales bacterium]|nr:hypothetical protein [Spirochaetales bacterium]